MHAPPAAPAGSHPARSTLSSKSAAHLRHAALCLAQWLPLPLRLLQKEHSLENNSTEGKFATATLHTQSLLQATGTIW